MKPLRWLMPLCLLVSLGASAFAMCPIPWYQTDQNDVIQVKGKVFDNAGNEAKVNCRFDQPWGAYGALTGGFSSPPARNFQGFTLAGNCPVLDWEVAHSIGPTGADVQIVKNGVPSSSCAFVGSLDAGSGYPYGFYVSAVLKFDGTGFRSEKGTLTYNLTTGSFIGTYKVVRKD